MSKANELLRRVLELEVLIHPERADWATLDELDLDIRTHLKDADSVQLIIAGSSRQAAHIAKAKGVQRYTYIACGEGLNGARRGGKIWLYGTYYSLPGWRMLRDMAKAYGYELVEIDE